MAARSVAIWRAICQDSEDYPWHWDIRSPDESDINWGHSMTLVETMTDFRRAWEAHVYKTAMTRARDSALLDREDRLEALL